MFLKEGSSGARCWPCTLYGLEFPALDLTITRQTGVEQFLYLAKESRMGGKANLNKMIYTFPVVGQGGPRKGPGGTN